MIAERYCITETFAADVYPESQAPNRAWNINYVQVANNILSLKSHKIDLLSCFMSLHHVEQFDMIVLEMVRIMKDGAHLFIREHDVDPNDK